MPEYKPVPSVAPEMRPVRPIHEDFGRIHFLTSIGEALGDLGQGRAVLGNATVQVGAALAHLGQSFGNAGDEIWNRALAIKKVENQTAATEADTQYMQLAAERTEAFLAQDGQAASQGLDAHMKGLDDLRKQIRSTLPNPEAQHDYDGRSLTTMGRHIWASARHAAQQGKASALGAANANFAMQLNNLELDATSMSDEQYIQKQKDLMDYHRNAIDSLDGTGTKGPQAELRALDTQSKIVAARIRGINTAGDPERALDVLEKAAKAKTILGATYDQLKGTITDKRSTITSRNEGDRAMDAVRKGVSADPNAPVPTQQEVEERAINNLPEWGKADTAEGARVREMTRRKVASDYREYVGGVQQGRQDSVEFLSGLLHPKGQKGLTTEQQLFGANPQAEKIYDSLPQEGQWSKAKIRSIMAENLRGNNRYDPLESGQLLQDIRGQVEKGGDQASAVLRMNPWDPDLHLNEGDRLRLQNYQKQLKEHPSGNPEVQAAVKWMIQDNSQVLDALHVTGPLKTDEMHNRMYGAVGAAIEDYKSKHNGMAPTREEFRKNIAPRILSSVPGTFPYGALGFGRPGEPAFIEQTLPSDKVDEYIRRKTQEQGFPPTPDQMHRDYQLYLWDQLNMRPGAPAPPELPVRPPVTVPQSQ